MSSVVSTRATPGTESNSNPAKMEASSINAGWGGKHARQSSALRLIANFNWLSNPAGGLYHSARIFSNAFSRWWCAENSRSPNGKSWCSGGVSFFRKTTADSMVDGVIREWNGRAPTTAPGFGYAQFKEVEGDVVKYMINTLLAGKKRAFNVVKDEEKSDINPAKKTWNGIRRGKHFVEKASIKASEELRDNVNSDFDVFLETKSIRREDFDRLSSNEKENSNEKEKLVKQFLQRISHRSRAAIGRDFVVHELGKEISPAFFKTSAALNHACLTAVASNNRVEDLTNRMFERYIMAPLEKKTGITFMANSQKRLLSHAAANSFWAGVVTFLGTQAYISPALIAAGFGASKMAHDNLVLAPRLRNKGINQAIKSCQEDGSKNVAATQNQIRASIHLSSEALMLFDKVVEFENADFVYERMRAEPLQTPNQRDFAVNAMTKSVRSPGLNQSKTTHQRLLQREVDNRLGELLALNDRLENTHTLPTSDALGKLYAILEKPLPLSGFQGAARLNLAQSMDALGVDLQTIKLYRQTLDGIRSRLESGLGPADAKRIAQHLTVDHALSAHITAQINQLADNLPDHHGIYRLPGLATDAQGKLCLNPQLNTEQKSRSLEQLTQLTYLLPNDRAFNTRLGKVSSADLIELVKQESLAMAEAMFKPNSPLNLAGAGGAAMLRETPSQSKITIWKQCKYRMSSLEGDAWLSRAQLHLTIAYQAYDHKRFNREVINKDENLHQNRQQTLNQILDKPYKIGAGNKEQDVTLHDFLARARVAAQVMGEALCWAGSSRMPNHLVECDHRYLDRDVGGLRYAALKVEKVAYTVSRALAFGGVIFDNIVPLLGGWGLRFGITLLRIGALLSKSHKPEVHVPTNAQRSTDPDDKAASINWFQRYVLANMLGIAPVGHTRHRDQTGLSDSATVRHLKSNHNYRIFDNHVRSRTSRTTLGGAGVWSFLKNFPYIPGIGVDGNATRAGTLTEPNTSVEGGIMLANGAMLTLIAFAPQVLNAAFKLSALAVSSIGGIVGRSIGLAGLSRTSIMKQRLAHYQATQANVERFRQALSYAPADPGKAVDEFMAKTAQAVKRTVSMPARQGWEPV